MELVGEKRTIGRGDCSGKEIVGRCFCRVREACQRLTVIHYSSGHVFSGETEGPRRCHVKIKLGNTSRLTGVVLQRMKGQRRWQYIANGKRS